MADKFRKKKSLYASTANTFGTGTSVTITPNSVSGLPTDTEITLTFDRVDSTGAATPDKMERIIGSISGGNFVVRTSPSTGRGADGTSDQSHTSPVVEYIPNAADENDLIDGILVEHTQAGAHHMESAPTLKQVATPSNPASGYNKFYPKSDGKFYTLSSAGVERAVGGGDQTETFIIAGTFPSSATTNLSKTWYAPAALTISKVDLYVSTAGSGTGSTVVDINLDGTTICASTKLTLTTTQTSNLDVTPSTTAVTKGQAITIDVDSVTATAAPADGYVLIHYTRN